MNNAPLATLLLIAASASWSAAPPPAAFSQQYEACRALASAIERLACYDALPSLLEPQDFPTEDACEDFCNELVAPRETDFMQSDDPNFFVYTAPITEDLGEEAHAEFYLSLKYPLLQGWFDRKRDAWEDKTDLLRRLGSTVVQGRALFIYNGLYDFYITESDHYQSSPIISRRQNPGLALEYLASPAPRRFNELRLAWMHESNGQQLEGGDNNAERERSLRRFTALSEANSPNYALGEVSRGWDYAQIRWQSSSHRTIQDYSNRWYRWHMDYRFFCNCQGFGIDGKEDEIWWQTGDDSEIHDYDGLRAMAEFNYIPFTAVDLELFSKKVLARVELKAGTRDSFLENLGGKLSLGMQFGNTRFTAFYFNGYGREPSTYHLRTEYAGLGVELR
jgi:hypothetical protein